MTPQQFWDEDSDLFFAYQKAYVNKAHKKAHIEGLYEHLALTVSLSNAFREKGTKAIEYPKEDVFNPFNQREKSVDKETFISKLDTTKNNNELFQIKKIIEERRKNK